MKDVLFKDECSAGKQARGGFVLLSTSCFKSVNLNMRIIRLQSYAV